MPPSGAMMEYSGQPNSAAKNLLPALRLIWVVLTLSVGIYCGICFYVFGERLPGEGVEQTPLLLPILAVAALLDLALAIILPRIMVRAARKRLSGADTPSTEGLSSGVTRMMPVVFVPLVVRYALLEAVMIVGLLAAVILHQPSYVLPFAAVSLAGFLFNVPGAGTLNRLYDSA